MSTPSANAMNLVTEDIRYIREHLGKWLTEESLGKPPVVYEIELRERMIRVEEEFGHQRGLIKTILERMDKRFEAVDRRFKALTKRIDRFMFWSFAITLSVGSLVVAILKL